MEQARCHGFLMTKSTSRRGWGWLRLHGDWILFLATAVGVAAWAVWFWQQPPAERRLSIVLDETSPALELTLSELARHNARMEGRCAALLSEVKALRGVRPGTPEAKRLDELVRRVGHGSFVEEHLRTWVLRDHESRLDAYHAQLVELSSKVDAAKCRRHVESLLQALKAATTDPTDVEGFYTNLWSHEMIIRKSGDQYTVTVSGGYWPSYNASWLNFSGRPQAGVMTAHYLEPDLSDTEYVDCTVQFDRGLAVVTAEGPWRTVCVSGAYVKIASLKPYQSEVAGSPALGAAGSSMDSWLARKELVEKGLVWTSEGRTALCPYPEETIETCEKFLGTYRKPEGR